MSYNLFLDDQRSPKQCRDYPGDGSIYDNEEWIEVSDFESFYQTIKDKGIPKFVSFDYQLGKSKSGLDCAKFLKFECDELNQPIPNYRVHSSWTGIEKFFNFRLFYNCSR